MQVKSISIKDPAQNTFMSYNYQYSPAGNISAKDTEHGDYAYQYDQLYRLIEATNPMSDDEGYTYDPIGNRLSAAGVEGSWSYNEHNELLGYGDVSYEYNDNGNMIRKTSGGQVLNYIYNTEDRLVLVEEDGSVIAEYYYDPFGRRLWKDVSGVKSYFLYADEGLVSEYDESGNEIKTYGYAPDSVWTSNPLFQKVGGIYYWYQNDHLGTSQKIVDASGRTVWSATYEAFGNIQIVVAEIENNLRFPGQYYDQETRFYYNWNRYYDPGVGRYLRADPFGEGLNLYGYVFNNPVNVIDPRGLCVLQIAGGITLGVTVGWTGIGAVGAGVLIVQGVSSLTAAVINIATHDRGPRLSTSGLVGLLTSAVTDNPTAITIANIMDLATILPASLLTPPSHFFKQAIAISGLVVSTTDQARSQWQYSMGWSRNDNQVGWAPPAESRRYDGFRRTGRRIYEKSGWVE